MPHVFWGIIALIIAFGGDRKLGVDVSLERLRDTRQQAQRIIERVKPYVPPVRYAKDDPTDAIWKLYTPTGSTGTAFVIGRSVDGRVLLVTAAHCVDGMNMGYVLGGGEFGEDVRFNDVSVLGRDEDNDVAVVQVASVSPYRPITVSQWRAGVEGETVEMAGYGGGVWSQHTAVLKQTRRVVPLEPGGLAPESWITKEIAVPGHSGSPVFDSQERLVGVVSRSGGGISVIVHARYVRWLLEEIGEDTIIDTRVPVDEVETNPESEGEPDNVQTPQTSGHGL